MQALSILRQFSNPVTLQDIESYCNMFNITDKAKLVKIILIVNSVERNSGE